MDSRLLQALLYLLPRNLYQSPDNPLQADRLPDTADVELDYPVYQDSPLKAARSLGVIVFLSSLVAPALGWTTHLIPIPFLYGGLNTVALLIAGALIVLGILGRWWPLASYGAAAAIIPALALLVKDVPLALASLALVFVAQAILADSVVTSYLHFKTAAPLPYDTSRKVRRLWRRRFFAFQSPLRGSELYLLGFLVLLPAAWCQIHAIAEHQNARQSSSVSTLFLVMAGLGVVWFFVHEWLVAPLFRRRLYSFRACASAMFRALETWSNYNRRAARGAGVHQMPSGSCSSRRFLLVGVVVAWGCIWAGLQQSKPTNPILEYLEQTKLFEGYFPNALPSTTSDKNLDETPKDGKPRRLNLDDSPELATGPELEPYEVEFLNRLPENQRIEYLASRVAAHTIKEEQDELARRQAAAAESPKSLLAGFFQRLGKVLINVLVPSFLVILASASLLFAMSARSLAGIEECFGNKTRRRVFTTSNWENLVARVRNSRDTVENQSVIVGVNARDDTPVLVPREVFGEHAHILGDSGSGKTSIGIVPLISQLIRFHEYSVVVIDLKADDQFILESLRDEANTIDSALKKDDAKHPGYRFRWFTTVLGRSSYAFNPLTQRVMSQLDPEQRTDIITAALGLQYGTDYGRKYFGDSNYDILNFALREYPNVQSFTELEQILAEADRFPLPQETKKAATHVRSSVRRFARYAALNVGPNQHTPKSILDNAIDLDDLFAQPQSIYVALPTRAGVSTTAELARIFLYSLLAAAQTHQGPRKKVILVIDEFQRIVSKNVELFLQTARSMDIGCILSNQSLADLDTIDANLLPAVRTNTRFRQVFGAGHRDDIRDIIDSSGETVYASRGWSFAPGIFPSELRSLSVNEMRGSRLTINDVLLATDAPGRNIACIRRGDGYAQFGGMPFLMDSVHHIDKHKYGERCTTSWPDPNPGTLVANLPEKGQAHPVRPSNVLGETLPASSVAQEGAKQTGTNVVDTTTAEPTPESAEGVADDFFDAMLEQMRAEEERRRKKLRSKKRPEQDTR